MAYILDDRN